MNQELKELRHETKKEELFKRLKELLISDIGEVRSNLKRLEERLNAKGPESIDPRFIGEIANSMDGLRNTLHELEAQEKRLGIQ